MNENERIARIKRAHALKNSPPDVGYTKDRLGKWRPKVPEGFHYNHHGELVPSPTETSMADSKAQSDAAFEKAATLRGKYRGRER